MTQDKAREWQQDPAVKKKLIAKKSGTSKTNSPAKASATTYWPELQKRLRKRAQADKAALLLYNHVLTTHQHPAHDHDDPFAFVSDEDEVSTSSSSESSGSADECLALLTPFHPVFCTQLSYLPW